MNTDGIALPLALWLLALAVISLVIVHLRLTKAVRDAVPGDGELHRLDFLLTEMEGGVASARMLQSRADRLLRQWRHEQDHMNKLSAQDAWTTRIWVTGRGLFADLERLIGQEVTATGTLRPGPSGEEQITVTGRFEQFAVFSNEEARKRTGDTARPLARATARVSGITFHQVASIVPAGPGNAAPWVDHHRPAAGGTQ